MSPLTYPTDIGPVKLTTVGDRFADTCRIAAVVWVGTTTEGQIAILSCPETGTEFWKGIANSETKTYQGISGLGQGIAAPYGFTASRLDGTTALYVYLREE